MLVLIGLSETYSDNGKKKMKNVNAVTKRITSCYFQKANGDGCHGTWLEC